ncbi:MAG: 2OG-Fe dioxygenase family protein [Lysobacteraceae bacterium]
MVATFSAPAVPLDRVVPHLRDRGFAVLAPADVAALAGTPLAALQALAPSWDDLAADRYLKDGGRYRQRRHACFVLEADVLVQAPHRAHWQPLEYNALHGGMHRWFEPITPAVATAPAFAALLRGLGRCFGALRPVPRWYVEAHQFRIDTAGGLGRPTPEGAHRDGVDFVAVFLVARNGIKGGETRVFAADGPDGQRFTLDAPWSVLLLDDARVIHESTPIQPLAGPGHRDTLVLTYRAEGFQGDAQR